MDSNIETKVQEALSVLHDTGVSFMLIVEDTVLRSLVIVKAHAFTP